MKLETARLVRGSETPEAEGTTGAQRCTLVLADGRRVAAILKRAPIGQVGAEAFSAVLLRAWGLPVPTPYLVPDDAGLAFASADAAYPNLRKRLGLDTLPAGPAKDAALYLACELACSLPSAGKAAAADEAIRNPDRNLGNILWDGATEAWIDHAYSLGQAPVHIGTRNKLCDMAQLVGAQTAMSTSAVAQAFALNRAAPHEAAQQLPPALQGQALADQVAQRISGLAMALLNRFSPPKDLLSGA